MLTVFLIMLGWEHDVNWGNLQCVFVRMNVGICRTLNGAFCFER